MIRIVFVQLLVTICLPLHIVNEQTAKQTLLQMTAEGFGKGKVISSQQMKALSDEMPLALFPRDSITKAVNFIRKFRVTLGSKAEWNDSTLDLLLRNSTIKWYTDASKTAKVAQGSQDHAPSSPF